MSEQNIVNVMVIPDVPKVLPGEQLYVYVPKASFTFPGIIAYNNTQFRIDGNFLFIREDYVSPGVQQKIDELKQYTDDELQLKQDKEDNNISLAQRPEQKSVVGAINDLGTLTGQAQATADDAIRKIGDLSNLTTDEKTTIVGAINEVDNHADANKAEIGNLSALTTDEKATLVGAINEVDAHTNTAQQAADAAQATADNATTLANTGISKADQAQATANTAVDKANDAKATANEAIMKADGRSNSIGFMTAKDAVTALNGYPRTQLKGGDTIWIVETGTPDLWVTEVAQESVPYNYTTKDKFNQDLVDNKVLQIGYFKTAYQESDGKPVTIAWQNVLVKSTDWVASTEFADFPYEAKIELTDFVDYTTVPQVVFDIADTMSGNYAPICKSGDKCVYIYGKVQDEITLKTVITFAPNVNGASITGGGYTNKGKWVASTTYAIDDLVYTDNGQYVCIEGITSTTSPEQDTQHWQATFVATGKTKNTLTISGQDNRTGVQKTFDGSQAVEIAFDENTMTIKEVDGVLKVGAKGTIPEALPQETSALKRGSLPTSESAWTSIGGANIFYGNSLPATQTWQNLGCSTEQISVLVSKRINGEKIWANFTPYSTRELVYYGDTSLFAVTDDYNMLQIRYNSKTGNVEYKVGSSGYEGRNEIIKWVDTRQSPPNIYAYTISDTSITANSDILMELTDDGGVKAHAIANGSITVIRDAVPTQPIPYTYKVKQTNASGQFTVVNHYVPSIPDSPTSLPVTYKKVSGSLPTSGWENEVRSADLWNGSVTVGGYGGSPAYNVPASAEQDLKNIVYHKTGRLYLYTDDGKEFVCTYSESASTSSEYTYTGIKDGIKMGISTNVDASPLTISARNLDSANHTVIAMSTYKLVSGNKTYTISDTSITANTSVKMYLTDKGGVKAYSKESGAITVISDEVPTTAIPYEYEVEQTSAEGLFEVINAYIPSAGEWQNWSSTSVLTEEGLYEIVAEGGSNLRYTFFIQYEQGQYNYGACWVSATSTDVSVIAPQCSADGKLSVKKSLASGGTTESLAFKYRKIN